MGQDIESTEVKPEKRLFEVKERGVFTKVIDTYASTWHNSRPILMHLHFFKSSNFLNFRKIFQKEYFCSSLNPVKYFLDKRLKLGKLFIVTCTYRVFMSVL